MKPKLKRDKRVYRELVSIPRFVEDDMTLTDNELVLITFIHLVTREAKKWNTVFYMHNHDFRCLLGIRSVKVKHEDYLERVRKYYTIGLVSDTTVTIQVKPQYTPNGTKNVHPTGGRYITCPEALRKYWFLAGKCQQGEIIYDWDENKPFFLDEKRTNLHWHFRRLKTYNQKEVRSADFDVDA